VNTYLRYSDDNTRNQITMIITVVIQFRNLKISRSHASPVKTVNKVEKTCRQRISEFFSFDITINSIANLVKHGRVSTKLVKYKGIMLVVNLIDFTPKVRAHAEERSVKLLVVSQEVIYMI
jgi:hypothetical protein